MADERAVAFSESGGPYGRGGYKLTWRGGAFAQAVDEAIEDALADLRKEILDYLRANLHKGRHPYPESMKGRVFARLDFRGKSQRRALVVGSNAPWSMWHEKGYVREDGTTFEGHNQFEQTLQVFAKRVSPVIRSAMARKGLPVGS